MTRLEQTINDLIKQANKQWQFFTSNDKVPVALSGGKDSLFLLYMLRQFDLQIKAVHIRLSKGNSLDFIAQNNLQNIVTVIESDIMEEIRNDKNPCFSCSRKRRKLILEFADSIKFDKIAMGHHRGDVIETLLLNMIFSREITTLNPRQSLFAGQFSIIRPLYMVSEKLITSLSKEQKWHIAKPVCSWEDNSKRRYIKDTIQRWQEEHPQIDIKDNIFSSLKAVKEEFLPFPVHRGNGV